jgi:hypothetical protein
MGTSAACRELRDFDHADMRNSEYQAFVEADGYLQAHWWSAAEGRAWLAATAQTMPRYWRHELGRWQQRRFANWIDLVPEQARGTHHPPRGRGLVPLGRPSAAQRSRMGIRRPARRCFRLGKPGLGMDRQRVRALPRLQPRPLRRICRTVLPYPSQRARRLLRHSRACATRATAITTSHNAMTFLSASAVVRKGRKVQIALNQEQGKKPGANGQQGCCARRPRRRWPRGQPTAAHYPHRASISPCTSSSSGAVSAVSAAIGTKGRSRRNHAGGW